MTLPTRGRPQLCTSLGTTCLRVDRSSASKALKQVPEGRLLLAFCRAHVRRDFLEAARSWPSEEAWALGWVDRMVDKLNEKAGYERYKQIPLRDQ